MKNPKVFYSHGMERDERGIKEGYVKFFKELLEEVFGRKNILEGNAASLTVDETTLERIKECDLVYALFSGRSELKKEGNWYPPSGVIYETGYAKALGTSVYGVIEKGVQEMGMIRFSSPEGKTSAVNIPRFDSFEDLESRRKFFKNNIQKAKLAIIKEGEMGFHCLNASHELVVCKDGYGICRYSRRFRVKYPPDDKTLPFTHHFYTEREDCPLPTFEEMSSRVPHDAYKSDDFFFASRMVEGNFRLNIDPADIIIDASRTKLDFQITVSGSFAKGDEFEYEYAIGGPNLCLVSSEQKDSFTFPHTRIDEAVLTLSFERGVDNLKTEPTFALFSYDKKRMRQETERDFDKRIGALYTSYSKRESDLSLFGGKLSVAWGSK